MLKLLKEPKDRLAHIETCKQADSQSPWGLVKNETYYERLGVP
jgi:hypothetical protein